ncbi:MAG: formylglycine-generating enzyme family protein, partial [Verrucomicrobiae bacterium]|nr:formylglycine-generating enzyme family protein [Verrucomicrobiae bacterium]
MARSRRFPTFSPPRWRPAVWLGLLALAGAAFAADTPSEKNSLGMTLRLVEGGRFTMGSDARDDGLERAFPLSINGQFFANVVYPAHRTWITKPFWMGETEVTVGQWKAFVAATGHVTTAEKSGAGIVGWSPTPADKPLYQSHDFERKPEFTWKNPGFPQTDAHPVVGVSFEDVSAFLKWLSQKEDATYRLPT